MDSEEGLKELGLPTYEAKAYIGLLKEGSSEADSVSKVANVPFSKIYSTLKSLEERGLVNSSNTRPKVYHPVSPSEAVSILRRERQEKGEAASDAIRDSLDPLYKDTLVSEMADVEIIHDFERATKRLLNVIMSSKSEVRAVVPQVPESEFSELRVLVEGLSRAGIELKIVTTRGMLTSISPLTVTANVRAVEEAPVGLLISDFKGVFVVFIEEGRFHSLWTENSFLVRLSHQLFDKLWEIGSRVEVTETSE